MLKLKLKHFGDSYLLQLSYYLWTVDIMLFLHGLTFKVIYYLIWHDFFFFKFFLREGSSHKLIRLTQFEKRKKERKKGVRSLVNAFLPQVKNIGFELDYQNGK